MRIDFVKKTIQLWPEEFVGEVQITLKSIQYFTPKGIAKVIHIPQEWSQNFLNPNGTDETSLKKITSLNVQEAESEGYGIQLSDGVEPKVYQPNLDSILAQTQSLRQELLLPLPNSYIQHDSPLKSLFQEKTTTHQTKNEGSKICSREGTKIKDEYINSGSSSIFPKSNVTKQKELKNMDRSGQSIF